LLLDGSAIANNGKRRTGNMQALHLRHDVVINLIGITRNGQAEGDEKRNDNWATRSSYLSN